MAARPTCADRDVWCVAVSAASSLKSQHLGMCGISKKKAVKQPPITIKNQKHWEKILQILLVLNGTLVWGWLAHSDPTEIPQWPHRDPTETPQRSHRDPTETPQARLDGAKITNSVWRPSTWQQGVISTSCPPGMAFHTEIPQKYPSVRLSVCAVT